MSSNSVIVYQTGPNWAPERALREQEHAMGHILFIRRILESGLAQLAGPFARLDEQLAGDTVGIIVFECDAEQALETVAQDPAVAAGLLTPQAHTFYPVPVPVA